MADITSGISVLSNSVCEQGGVAIVTTGTTASADAQDYFDMDTVLGHDVDVVFAIGMRDKAGTPAVDPCSWTATSTTPDRVTIGAGADNATRVVQVHYKSRKSTGGSA